jgi:rRNA processing protein Krr1/Pno1
MPTPTDAEMLQQMQQRLESVTAEKAQNAAAGKQLDEKLRLAFKSPPRRPNMTAERISKEMEEKEWYRNTTSMSAGEERVVLRELQSLKEKLAQQQAADEFQAMVDKTRAERQERFEKHKEFEATLQQLQQGIRKLKLAAHIEKPVADFITVEVSVPADRMGAVIGKQFAHVHQMEKECCAMLEVDNKQNTVKITSAPEQVQAAKDAIEDITLATNQSIGLHPDTVKVLMFQKAKHLHELEQSLKLKIDISKGEGILTTMASPQKAKQLKKTIEELTAGKVDILLPSEIVPKLIGKKGETINQLMDDTGALVDIDKVTNNVRLVGTKESVASAETFVRELITEQSQREKNFTPDNKELFKGPEFAAYKFEFFAEFLMANKAKQLRLLRADASEARIKVFKKERRIHVLGNKKQIDAMEDALRERLKEFEQHHWVHEVADNHLLSLIIGKKGSKIKEIEGEGKDSNVRIDIQDTHVCVFGDNEEAINNAKTKIMEIVDNNQRSVFVTSRYLIAVLMSSKREKLSEIETSSGCKLHLPPPPRDGASRSSESESDQIKISLTGTLEAIQKAKEQLEELDEAHHVRYVPLDNDEIPIVIGKKGETVSELESKSGAKVRVLRGTGSKGTGSNPSELEMIGTEEQLKIVQAAIDELLQTQNRQLLQLDAFATGCLIGKKGERIKTMRLAHPEATLDAFPNRGQVRVKAASPEALQACVDDVLKTLQETHVIESVHVPQQEQSTAGVPRATSNFNTLLEKHASIAMRLQELEAEGGEGMRVSFQDDGRLAKIRGPAMGIGKIKKFLEMLVSPDSHFVETIPLPSIAFANALEVKGEAAKLNENALRICKQTGCELRVKRTPAASGSVEEGTIRIEGTNASKVYEAKAEVEKVLQFYYTDCFQTLEDLPPSIATRMYELLPTLRAKYSVVFSLPTKTSLKVFADSKTHAQEISKQLQKDVEAWKKQHVELPIAGWLVPILVGRSGETIKKISSESNARLDLSAPSPSGARHEDRVLTISSRDDAAIKLAAEKVEEVLTHHKNLSSVVDVTKAKLDVALSVKKDAAKGVQFHVIDGKEKGELQVVIYGADHDERERLTEKIEHLLEIYVVETIALPTTVSPAFASSMVGSLIGKSGANIRALQKQFPDVMIDIRRGDSSITLKGPTEEVQKVRTIMEDKIQELLRNEEEFQQRRSTRHQHEPEEQEEDGEKKTSSARDAETSDENAQPNAQPQRQPSKQVGPVGGTLAMGEIKLTKNQRRRMRKRAENEKSDVLSMLVGNGQAAATTTTTTTTKTVTSGGVTSSSSSTSTTSSTKGGYYHSSSGYSLRL